MSALIENLKDWMKVVSNIHIQGKKKDIFLFATPRGGSTWVMEILASQPNIKHFDEPFSIRRDNVRKVNRFNKWEDLMPEAGRDNDILKYIQDLKENNIGIMNPAPFRKQHRFFTNRIVFKIHELEHLINKIETQCKAQIVYLLRHPIPTSLSRHVLPRLELYLNSDLYRNKYLTRHQINEAERICNEGTNFQRGVLAWCLENIIPLKYSDTSDWLIVSYEEILLNPVNVCKIMLEKLEFERLDLMLRAIDQPAVNINMSGKQTSDILEDDDAERRHFKLVTKWKNNITDEEIHMCFELLNLFGLDAYSFGSYIANKKYVLHPDTLIIEQRLADIVA